MIRLTAPPVGGEANKALTRFLSQSLAVPRSAVRLIQGEKSRQKVVRIEGLSLENFKARLPRP